MGRIWKENGDFKRVTWLHAEFLKQQFGAFFPLFSLPGLGPNLHPTCWDAGNLLSIVQIFSSEGGFISCTCWVVIGDLFFP